MSYDPIPLDRKVDIARAFTEYSDLMSQSRTDSGRLRYQRMHCPMPGDWVIEDSTLGLLLHWYDHPEIEPRMQGEMRSVKSCWDGQVAPFIGVSREWHPWYEDAFNFETGHMYWTVGAPLDGYWERFLIVENPDGTEFRWTNASIRAIPPHLCRLAGLG